MHFTFLSAHSELDLESKTKKTSEMSDLRLYK